jgi:hypothetical protein
MPKLKVNDELLTAALAGYQVELERIDVKMDEIRRTLGDRTDHASAPSETKTPKRKFSATSRRKMRIAQKLRWQKIKQAAEPPQTESAKPKKRKMSAAGKAAIVAALKKRWAAVKAAKQSRPTVSKRASRKGPKKSMKKAVANKSAKTPEQSVAATA